VIITHFATALEAQNVFYEALQRADLAQMMAVWAEDEDIVCIHPGGPRHTGNAEVRESWRRIFSRGPELKFELIAQRTYPGRVLSVHNVHERISHVEESSPPTSVIATNVFVLSGHGWRMILHHGSPMPDQPVEKDHSPAVLH